ncbi:hypothetical protein [Francisella orientalis]|uniref:hypothetical protein n=1 Tax=Francisella orientalis TaxID=299583 RepID=UPI003530D033
MSIALFILRTLDAIFDPIIGWYCDEFHYPSKISLIAIITIFIAGVYIICIPVFTNIIVNLALEIFFYLHWLLAILQYSQQIKVLFG